MTNMALIHKSKKYADQIMEKIDEDRIRDIVFRCWVDAYAAGYEAADANPRQPESMGQ